MLSRCCGFRCIRFGFVNYNLIIRTGNGRKFSRQVIPGVRKFPMICLVKQEAQVTDLGFRRNL